MLQVVGGGKAGGVRWDTRALWWMCCNTEGCCGVVRREEQGSWQQEGVSQ